MINKLFKSCVFSILITCICGFTLLCFNTILDLTGIQILIIASTVFFVFICLDFLFDLLFQKYFIDIDLKKEKELKTAEKYRREFLGNVSHELKTPIFNIQGYVETLLSGALYDKAVNKKYLKRTSKSVDRLIYIIKDLETISQLESAELKLDIKKWKLKYLINEIFEQFEIKAKQKGIRLIHDKKSTNCLVLADKGKIAQVLYNLISNSIKYGNRGGKTTISCHQSKNKCVVMVKDNGIGVANKNINRLFERFYRVDKSRSREQGGTGLGLAIVKHILEAHNETINVQSNIGKGTEFLFSLSNANDSTK